MGLWPLTDERIVLVTGCRDYPHRDLVWGELDDIRRATSGMILIEGGATGADRHAATWAADRGVTSLRYRSDWAKYGKSAGPRRNQEMLDAGHPTLVIAFPGGTGTQDMIDRAVRAKIPTCIIARCDCRRCALPLDGQR